MDIKDKTFVVTGAARGLGKAICMSLAGQGANVALVDVTLEALEQTVEQCQKINPACNAYLYDITEEDNVAELFTAVENDLGPVYGLVNNAGILRDALLVKAKDGEIINRMSLDQWQSVIDVNLTGVFLCGREAASKMIESGAQGIIINISSVSRAGNIGQSNYAAAKAGVAALTATWAKELARFGIRSAAIAPGVFETDMVAAMKPEAKARFTAAIPAGRTGELEELASAVNFILQNDYFNGRVLELDGGLRL